MRIRELRLIRYGKFTDRALSLPCQDKDIHLIVGPNEAGKSTLRTAIGDWLFGIPMRTPLAFLHPMPELRIGGVLERPASGSAAAAVFAFDRTKGNKNTLRSPDDKPLQDAELQTWLGGLQVEAFKRMYALDHTTLVDGGAGILSASDDVGRMLFQSATGLEHLGSALKKIQDDAEKLWAPRKASSRVYYQALDAYDAAQAEFKRATLRTKDWMAQHEALSATEAKLRATRARQTELSQQMGRFQRIRRVRPLLSARDAAIARRLELLAAGEGPLLEENAAQQYAGATRDLALAESDIARLKREEDEIVANVQATKIDDTLLPLREDITELNERRLQFRAHRTDIVKRAEEIRLEWLRVQELARSLAWPAESEEGVRQRLPATPLRTRLAALIRDRSALAAGLKAARGSLADRTEQIRLAETALSELAASAIDPELGAAVDQAMKLGDHEKAMADLRDQVEGLTQEIEGALASLGSWRRPVDELRAMLPPDTAQIQAWIDQHRADAAEDKTLCDALTAKAREIAQLELELQQFLRKFQPVSREQVLEARRLRDDSWQAIRRAPESVPERAAGFEAQITRADTLSDDRLDRASYEADRQSKTDALEHRRREHEDLEHRIATVRSRMTERLAKWDALATASGLPALPLEMALPWLQMRQTVLELDKDRSAAERRGSTQEAAAGQLRERFWRMLSNTTSDFAPPALDVCLRQARALIQQADQTQGQRKTLEQQIRDGRRSLSTLQEALQSAQVDWDAWIQAWEMTVQSVGYGAEVPVEQVEAELAVMQQIERQLDRIRDVRSERIETMQADLDGLAATAASLASRVAPDLAAQAPEDIALELARRLDVAQQSQAAVSSLQAQLERCRTAHADAVRMRDAVFARLAPMMTAAGVHDMNALARAVERSDERRAIEARIHSAERELADTADGLAVEQLKAESDAIGTDELIAELDRLEAESRAVIDQIQTLSNESGAQKTAFDALDGADRAARADAQRQEAIAAMADAAEQYLRLQTAARLLKWSIEKFRETRQGPMLAKASAIFKGLTMESFDRLAVDSDGDTPRLLGVRAGGEQVDVTGMSEGSRDQLYLALRLAALELQVEQGLNMPLIADDLFINFDDRRTAAGLKVLGELSRSMQVVFLTHHDHLVPLAREVLGEGLNVVGL